MAAMRDTFGPQTHHETSARDLHWDIRPWFQRLSQALQNSTVAGVLLGTCAAGVALVPATVELLVPAGVFYAAWVMTRPVVMPLRPPMRSGLVDVTDPDPETGKPRTAQGLDHIGAEMGTRRQVWHGKDDVAQHTAVPGTTGAGKTEALIALAVVNALVQGTGCVFVDGKADRKCYAKIFTLARRYGREDDVFVWNFLTLDGRDSMTCNPFGPASAHMIREIMVGQLNEPGREGNGGVFFSRAVGFLGVIAPVLAWMRDEKGIQLDLEKIRDATELSNVVLLARAGRRAGRAAAGARRRGGPGRQGLAHRGRADGRALLPRRARPGSANERAGRRGRGRRGRGRRARRGCGGARHGRCGWGNRNGARRPGQRRARARGPRLLRHAAPGRVRTGCPGRHLHRPWCGRACGPGADPCPGPHRTHRRPEHPPG